DTRSGKLLGEQTLDLLGVESSLPHDQSAAAWTARTRCLRVPAVVAHESLGRAMIGETDRTVGTDGDVSALRALNERRVAAPVEKQAALLVLGETVAKRDAKLGAEDALEGRR